MSASVAVPDSLVLKGATVAGEAGPIWRDRLAEVVQSLVQQWHLRIEHPFPGLSYNYAAPVTREDGTAAVLKLWFPNDSDFRAEADTLRLYNGDGAVRLLALDIERRALLLERAEPGTDLWQLQDEDQQIEITASIMRRLWRQVPSDCTLPTAASQFRRMSEVAPDLASRGFPLPWVERACAIFNDLDAASEPVVLHGDLHQANILRAQREPWLAIDPHGLVGPRELDTIQMILNVLWPQPDAAVRRLSIARYVDKLAGALALDRNQIRLCGVARAVLNAFWGLEDGEEWQRDIAIAEDFAAVSSG